VSAEREALIARWASASHQSRLLLATNTHVAPPPNLRELAARELATPGRYHLSNLTAPPQTPVWMRALTWLRDRWVDLWQAVYGHAHLGRGTAIVIGDVLVMAVVLVIAFVGLRLMTTVVLERRRRSASSEPLAPAHDAAAMYAAACDHARQGDYTRASRLLFAATVAVLSRRGLVHDDRSATVGEFRRALRADDVLVASFDAVSSAFVTSAYAERPVRPSQWERARAAFVSLADATA
jgi:hypothetical protein